MKNPANPSTEQKIIDSSIIEFSEYGLGGARIDRIAQRANVNKAMIYYHFKSKNDLYEKILTDTLNNIYSYVSDLIPDEKMTLEQLYSLISYYCENIISVDLNFVKIMIREIGSGGDFFRKIALPGLLLPILKKTENLIDNENHRTISEKLDPFYTIIQILGSIIFFNFMRISLAGTDLKDRLLRKNYIEDYKNNLLELLKNGIEREKE